MRRFPNGFLSAYEEWARNVIPVPPQYHTWAGLSVVAGALERRVWLPWRDGFSFYPNIYVLLVGHPAVKKSTAIDEAVAILRAANAKSSALNILPNLVTEAKFFECMGHMRRFRYCPEPSREFMVPQCAGYYVAREASSELKNLYGDFIAALTNFYDCPTEWTSATIKNGERRLENVCVNLIAASTFSYLGELVNSKNIQGGFASRLVYVVHNDVTPKRERWQAGLNAAQRGERDEFRSALIEDLAAITQMVGPMQAEPAVQTAWEEWFFDFESRRLKLASENLQSLLARTNTNAIKVAMLICAAEAEDMVIRLDHWERAMTLMDSVTADLPAVFQSARASSAGTKDAGPTSLSAKIIHLVRKSKGVGLTDEELLAQLVSEGAHEAQAQTVLKALIRSKSIKSGQTIAGRGTFLILGANTDNYL